MPGWLTAEMLTRLRGGPWFASLPPAMADALLQAANLKRLQAGETLFMRGAPADGIFAVLEGSLRVSGMTADGGSRRGNSGCAAAVKRFGSVARKPKSGIHPISRKYD